MGNKNLKPLFLMLQTIIATMTTKNQNHNYVTSGHISICMTDSTSHYTETFTWMFMPPQSIHNS